MGLATSLIKAARKLIDLFGNSASLYSISGATSSVSDEGEYAISSWGTATTVKVVDGTSVGPEMTQVSQGYAKIEEDEKIVKDNVTVAINDRLNYNNEDYRIVAVREDRVESDTIIQIIKCARANSTTTW